MIYAATIFLSSFLLFLVQPLIARLILPWFGGSAALATLPIMPVESWKPAGGQEPITRILLLLGATVGLPYFLLASTSPLIQAWFARARPGANPYRLFALSNFASLIALLGYPFFVEPVFAA